MPRGGKRPGAGRPPGAISKSTRAILEAAAAGGETPLEYMLRIMRDPREPAARRDARQSPSRDGFPFAREHDRTARQPRSRVAA